MSKRSRKMGLESAKSDAQTQATNEALARLVFVDDLPESTKGEFLVCPNCYDEVSATRGDYFWMPKDQPFVCEDCDEPMSLAIAVTRYVTLKGEEV